MIMPTRDAVLALLHFDPKVFVALYAHNPLTCRDIL